MRKNGWKGGENRSVNKNGKWVMARQLSCERRGKGKIRKKGEVDGRKRLVGTKKKKLQCNQG